MESDQARTWLNENRGGGRFYFGRYNGETPVAGHEFRPPNANGSESPNTDKLDELTQRLVEAEKAYAAAVQHSQTKATEQAAMEVLSFFPRLEGAEMRSRWDMQDSPPDILLPIFSMLSIMLMRDAGAPIFERTKKWLESPDAVFHLVVDELHLYRGTAGTEVAYLLRLLLHRLGLEPSSPKLRILASSASLDADNEASLQYLLYFFGTPGDPSHIIQGHFAPVSSEG